MLNPWLAFSFQAARLGWETQNVIASQLMRLAGGRAAGQSEAHGIRAEKAAALDKVPTPRAAVAVKGGNGRGAAKKVTRVAKKRIRGNKRRVSK
jgi:hypothetical protein